MKYIVLTLALLFATSATLAAEDSVDTLYDLDKSFSDYSSKHGFQAAFAEFLAEDTVKLDPQSHPIIGRASVLSNLPPFSKNLTITWVPHGGDISSSKDLGYTWGIYTAIQTAEDNSLKKSYGKYITIWKKSSEGNWQIVLDGGNSSLGAWPDVAKE